MEHRTIDRRLIALLILACAAMVGTVLIAILTHHLITGIVVAAAIRMGWSIARSQMGL